jgi:transcriptional regulator with XRE-family HTH domain
MTGREFTALLQAAGLRQVDLARLVTVLSGGMPGPDAGTLSRYANDRRAVPASLVALVRLYRRQPPHIRHRLIQR